MRELEQDLVAAEEAVNRLESEARARSARIEELEKAAQHLRATLEEVARATPMAADPAAEGVRFAHLPFTPDRIYARLMGNGG